MPEPIDETQFSNSDIERRLANLLLSLTRGQVGQFQKQQTQQDDIFSQLFTQLGTLEGQQNQQIAAAGQNQSNIPQILEQEQQRILQGGVATPEDIARINEATQAAFDLGAGDIRGFAQNQLQDIADILAPSRGFRPGDAPILEQGNRVGQEAVQQISQLDRALRANAAQQVLTYPLARDAQLSGQAQFQAGLQESTRNFVTQLQQQAFANRATLAQLQTGAGLNLLGNTSGGASALGTLSSGNLGLQQLNLQQGQIANQPSTSFWSNLGNIGAAAGGIGGLLEGIGSLW